VKTKKKSSSEKSNDVPEKESKLSSKPLNLKRNNKRRVSKKKTDAADSHLTGSLASSSTYENKAGQKTERLDDSNVPTDGIKNSKDADFTDAKIDSVSEVASDDKSFRVLNDDDLVMNESNSAVNDSGSVEAQTEIEVPENRAKIEDVLMNENVDIVYGQEEKQENVGLDNGSMRQVEMTEQVEKLEPLKNDGNNTIKDEVSGNTELQKNEEIQVENSQKFVVERKVDVGVNENLLEPEREQEQELLAESIQNLDLLSSVPVAASTPQKKEPLHHNTHNNGSEEPLQYNTADDDQFSSINDLLKESNIPPNQNIEQDVGLDVGNKAEENLNVNNEKTMIDEETKIKGETSDLTSNQVGNLLVHTMTS
jgi:hypothetical protein